MSLTADPAWQPISLLEPQFIANLQALSARYPELASTLRSHRPAQLYALRAGQDRLMLGCGLPPHVDPLPNPVPPQAAAQIVAKLFPRGGCTEPVAVAGLDQGWLWQALHQLRIDVPAAPGHRPPLYFLCRELSRLWLVLHLHDWRNLLADPRVLLFVGEDAAQQLGRLMNERPDIPWSRLSVTVDPAIWPKGVSNETLFHLAHHQAAARLTSLRTHLDALYATSTPGSIAQKLDGAPLRILGITSRFTTFLQYSMRDWLDACKRLGHETQLLIEQSDHEMITPLTICQAMEEFRPDLILMIDHYRAELKALPHNLPCVMWVQDRLPNIFNARAGREQGPLDYVIGHGRLECVTRHGYPPQRYMPCMVGFNELRFGRQQFPEQMLRDHACDISFVSHASATPEQLVADECARTSSREVHLFLHNMLRRLREIYDADGSVTEEAHIARLVQQVMAESGLSTPDPGPVMNFVVYKLNNALFRHQALRWVSEMDVDFRLYGKGWEQHPTLARFARGVADNQTQLGCIHRASRINLQITPLGAVHQRLFDGLAAGGFFLLRSCTGDECDLLYRRLWQWCQTRGIESAEQLLEHMDDAIQPLIHRMAELSGNEPRQAVRTFFLDLPQLVGMGFTRSPATLWEQYDQVAFASKQQLHARVLHYLAHPEQAEHIRQAMLGRVVNTMSYTAITRRMLAFIADELRDRTARLERAA